LKNRELRGWRSHAVIRMRERRRTMQQHTQHPDTVTGDVRRLALARGLGTTFGSASYVVQSALLYAATHSAAWTSFSLLAAVITHMAMGPLSGAIADRYSRQRVAALSRCATAIGYSALVIFHSPVQIVVMSVVTAALYAPYNAAIDAGLPRLAGTDRMAWASGIVSASRTAGQIAGPLIGGLMIACFEAGTMFAIEAAVAIAAGSLVASIRGELGGGSASGNEHQERSVSAVEGLRLIVCDRTLRTLVGGWSIACVGFGMVTVSELPMAHHFGQGATGFAIMIATWSLGGLGGSLHARSMSLGHAPNMMATAMTGATASFAVCAATPWFFGLLGAMLIGGMLMAQGEVADGLLVQERTRDSVRGRVSAARGSLQMAAFASSLVVSPLLVSAVGPQWTYAVAAGLCSIGAIVFLRFALHMQRKAVIHDQTTHTQTDATAASAALSEAGATSTSEGLTHAAG
jgi:MFS family permease